MDIKPILSSCVAAHGRILVALQIALALAITVNSLYIIKQRSTDRTRPGMDVPSIFFVSWCSTTVSRAKRRCARTAAAARPAGRRGGDDRQRGAAVGGGSRRRCTRSRREGRRGDINYFQVDEQGLQTSAPASRRTELRC